MATKKAPVAKTGPIAKPRKKLVKPNIQDLYPWASNRGKAERAHIAVHEEMERNEQQNTDAEGERYVAPEDVEQHVMDHYVTHGGLVIGQEKATIVGRRKDTNFKPGMTTTEVVEDAAADDDDDDDDEVETPAAKTAEDADSDG